MGFMVKYYRCEKTRMPESLSVPNLHMQTVSERIESIWKMKTKWRKET